MTALSLIDESVPFLDFVAQQGAVVGERPFVTHGLTFKNRVGLAGGADKNGIASRAFAALGFGFVEVGTVTAEAQLENPPPNMFRLPKDRALINRLGFPNEGARALRERLQKKPTPLDVPLAISIGKSRSVDASDVEAVLADYARSFAAVRGAADFVIVNVSSPNTANLRSLQTEDVAARLGEALVAANDERESDEGARPILLKIAPDLEDEVAARLSKKMIEVGFSGIVATNTTTRREPLATDAKEVEAMGQGGLSGAPLHARAKELVTVVRSAIGKDALLIGVGGIGSAEDALAMRGAGADLVQIYTGLVYEGPALIRAIREAFAARDW